MPRFQLGIIRQGGGIPKKSFPVRTTAKFYPRPQTREGPLGGPFDPNVYLDYLTDKCRDVYGI